MMAGNIHKQELADEVHDLLDSLSGVHWAPIAKKLSYTNLLVLKDGIEKALADSWQWKASD